MNYDTLKRSIDLILVFVLMILFAPVALLVAIAIKLESPGGAVLAETPPRVGKDGKLFFTLKFRSMIPNAHILIRTDPQYKEAYAGSPRNQGGPIYPQIFFG
jgi:lipopolysaccharide/colanic/teichoic acid biosynthesis glycosyltransferase